MPVMSDIRKKLIGITGGIGTGKSVVSRILRLKSFPVYDCDSRARMLMEDSERILESLRCRYGSECILPDGKLNRTLIASKVFTAEEERLWLNSLVHAEVRKDLEMWANSSPGGICFVESAIMVSSHLDRMCDEIWLVEAPAELRIERALKRGGISRENLMLRMESQRFEFDMLPEEKVKRISNDGSLSLLSQITELINCA